MRKPSRWCTATRLTSMNRCLCVCMSVTAGFPGGSVVRNPPACVGDAGDAGSIPGSGRSPGGGNGSPLQTSCRETPRTEGPGGLQSMGSQRGKPDLGTNQPQRWLCLAHLSRDVCVFITEMLWLPGNSDFEPGGLVLKHYGHQAYKWYLIFIQRRFFLMMHTGIY